MKRQAIGPIHREFRLAEKPRDALYYVEIFTQIYIVVCCHIAASGWIITGSRIVPSTIHEIQ